MAIAGLAGKRIWNLPFGKIPPPAKAGYSLYPATWREEIGVTHAAGVGGFRAPGLPHYASNLLLRSTGRRSAFFHALGSQWFFP